MITYHFIKSISTAIKNSFKIGFGIYKAIILAPIKFIQWLGGR